jgi:hypothetical protein
MGSLSWIIYGIMGALIGSVMYCEKKSVEKNKGKIIGVDGWLLLFVIFLFFSSSISVVGQGIGALAELVSGTFTAQAFAEHIIEVLLALFGFYTGICLVRIERRAPAMSKWYLAISIVWVIMLFAAAVKGSDGQAIVLQAILLFLQAFNSVFWLLYLFFSKRVKNTYFTKHKKIPIPKTSIFLIGTFALIVTLVNVIVFVLFALDTVK